jgi:hypothetical protein
MTRPSLSASMLLRRNLSGSANAGGDELVISRKNTISQLKSRGFVTLAVGANT